MPPRPQRVATVEARARLRALAPLRRSRRRVAVPLDAVPRGVIAEVSQETFSTSSRSASDVAIAAAFSSKKKT